MNDTDLKRLEYLYNIYEMNRFSVQDILLQLNRDSKAKKLFKDVSNQDVLSKYLKTFVKLEYGYLDYILGSYLFQFTREGWSAVNEAASKESGYSKDELIEFVMELIYLKFQMDSFPKKRFFEHIVDKLRKNDDFMNSWFRYFAGTTYGDISKIGAYLLKEPKYLRVTSTYLGRRYKINHRVWMPSEELRKKYILLGGE